VNIFNRPYEEAGKLVARVNMDWLSNPKSRDVSYRYMWEGCKYILPVIYECDPVLIIPMDEKTFSILQIALYNDGYKIRPVETGSISIMISGKNQKKRYHRNMMAFGAEKENVSFLVIKSPQHPARIYDNEYAKRVGLSIRMAAKQIWGGDDINLDIE
jgi:hypothetical protein